MKVRLQTDDGVIGQHLDLHERMLGNFEAFRIGLNVNNRPKISNELSVLSDNLRDYAQLVQDNEKRFGQDAFLDYPVCLHGHYFLPLGYGFSREKVFNPTQTFGGLFEEILEFQEEHDRFLGETRKVPNVEIGHEDDYKGNGIGYDSLRGRLVLTKELLRRIGYEVRSV
jgi:hypothetical protein